MGRVFSLEQVRNADEHIPNSQDFNNAVAGFESSVEREIERGTVTGAFIYGSVAIGTYGRRSDLDCGIVPIDHSPNSQEGIDRIVVATNPTGRIEVNPILHTRQRLMSGNHEIDRYFGEHLKGESRLVYGIDPAAYIRFANHDAATIMLMYLEHKKRSIAPGMTPHSPEFFKGLQRILELPLAIGRKALRAYNEVNGTSKRFADSANRTYITPAVLAFFEELALDAVPQNLLALDQQYSKVLDDILAGAATDKDYTAVLAEIRARGGEASVWLDQIDIALKVLLSRSEIKL